MSITTPAPATRDAGALLTETEFADVVSTVLRANIGMDESLAKRIVLEALRFVATAAERAPGERMAPSPVVDEGWHALILHTRVYARLNARLGGRDFVHHIPQAPDPGHARVPGILASSRAAITAAGFEVDTELWQVGPTAVAGAECQHVPNCGDNDCDVECKSGPN
ncbi:hypothetical protein [Streptomyces lushanensis]|uniref:hypothetical protein n=1 Tax=Streptomyces lushanensis TaxID=1434255 RepID=UPI0008329912|nr:hypothetical protein [Streptomyces lushanensis]